MAAKIKLKKEAKKKIEKTAMEKCSEYAEYVKDEMVKKYKEEIENFYDDPRYNPPRKYIRHEDRGYERGMNLTYEPIYEKGASSVKGGIKISTDNMHPGGVKGAGNCGKNIEGYRGTQEQVLNSFLNGLHGVLYYNAMDDVFGRNKRDLSTHKFIYHLNYEWKDYMAQSVSDINEYYLGGSNRSPMVEMQKKLVELKDKFEKEIK